MRLGLIAMCGAFLLAACGQTIQARCNGDAGCIKQAEAKILTAPGSAFQKSRRGGPG